MPSRPQRFSKNDGFTLLEAVMVIVILGVLAAAVVPNLDGLSPKYRLRAAARNAASTISWTRSLSGGTGEAHGIYYNLSEQYYEIFEPPLEEDDPELPFSERPRLTPSFLPDGVRIIRVVFPDGRYESSDEVFVLLDPFGNEGSHILWIQNEEERTISVTFNAMLGVVDFHDGEAEFPEF